LIAQPADTYPPSPEIAEGRRSSGRP
jgi:hypothetical protein